MDTDEIKIIVKAMFFSIIISLIITMIISVPVSIIHWYSAGIQQQVWERQGCKMTQWEVFIGTEPITRYIKEDK